MMIKKEIYKAWAEINISNLKHNIREIKKLINDPKVEIMAVLKDDAYGHGIKIVAPAVIEEGINHIGVATVLEGKKLRELDKNVNIIVFGCFFLENIEYVFDENLIPVLCSFGIAKSFNTLAKKRGLVLDVHLMLDTGMGRVGVWHKKAVDFVKKVRGLSNLNVVGICSHFSCADETDNHFSKEQFKRFKAIIKSLEQEKIDIKFKHIANSAGIINFPESVCNMVRPGIALYGIDPAEKMNRYINLKPVLTLKTWIVYLKSVHKGRTISYGRQYETSKRGKIATISIGYGDGYNRLLSNTGEVIVRGKKAPVVGIVTMDQTMIDVTAIPNVRVGDEVLLIGEAGNQKVTVREIASKIGSIPYEVICYIGRRVKRIVV